MQFDHAAEHVSEDAGMAVNILQPGMPGDFTVVAFVQSRSNQAPH
jgi:hypothetical protein